jgi:lipoprotein-releasing system permease protein
VVTKYGMLFSEYPEVCRAVSELPEVESASPFVLHEMLVTRSGNRNRPGALVKGVDLNVTGQTEQLAGIFRQGRPADLVDARASRAADEPLRIGVGYIMARRLRVGIGDEVTLVSPLRGIQAAGWGASDDAPASARATVSAILDTGFYDYDNRLVLADYRSVQTLFARGDVVTGVDIRLRDAELAGAAVASIERVLPTGRFRAMDWRTLNKNLFQSLNQQRLWISLVMSVVMLVSSTVIFCVLVMMVIRKRRQIAILRSMGATAASVLRIFMLEGAIIGGLGISIGLLLGWITCMVLARIDFGLEYEVYRIKSLPVSLDPAQYLFAAASALVLCLLATLPAALRAARVVPVEALRSDNG